MNKKGYRVEKRAERVLRRALAPLNGAVVHSSGDGRVTVQAPGIRATKLRVLWAGEGWPGDVQELMAAVPEPWPRDLVVTAAGLSPGALTELNRVGANFADELGRAHLVVPPGLLVEREGVSSAKEAGRPGWSRSSEAVGEWLLARAAADRDIPMVRTVDVAAETGWSPGQVSNVLRFFDQQGWTRREGPARGPKARRVLADIPGLLDAWSGYVASTSRRTLLAHALIKEPMHWITTVLAPQLDGARWALSGIAAAEMLQPTMIGAPSVVHCYLPDDDFDAAVAHACDAADVRLVDSGERIVFWAAPPWVWTTLYPRPDTAIPIASIARVHADLLRIGGRTGDAASALRERQLQRP